MILVLTFAVSLLVTTGYAAAVETQVETLETTFATEPITEPPTEPVLVNSPSQENDGTNIASITLIMSSITAIAAVVSPTIGSFISSRYQRKTKEIEIKLPAAYERLDNLVDAYGKLCRYGGDYSNYPEYPYQSSPSRFRAFRIAFYQLLPLIPDREIHMRARSLISQISNGSGGSDEQTDTVFYGIIEDIALHISGGKLRLIGKQITDIDS